MKKNWPAFLGGMIVALAIVWGGFAYFPGAPRDPAPADPAPASSVPVAPPPVEAADELPAPSVGSVTIRVLPTLYILRGQDVPFQGRAEIPLDLSGKLAGEISVVAFRASGENAQKSVIRIVWEDGSVETIPAGAKDITLAPLRRAAKITVRGYSFHERRVFKDVARKGALSWEIRYAPVSAPPSPLDR